MRENNRRKKSSSLSTICFFLLIAPLLFFPVFTVHAKEIVVIVSKKNNTSSLSLKDVQRIFLGKKKVWEGGEHVTLFLPPAKSEAMKSLAHNTLQMDSVDAVYQYYLKAVFRQEFVAVPKSVDNAVAEVAVTPGGIAIIDTSEAGDTSSVKVIKVGGL